MSEPLIVKNAESYDLDTRNTRKIINEIRASFGAPPTTMTDEQIEAVYGANLDYDMAVIDEVQDTREHMDNGVSVHMRPNDSREQLEADLREWVDIATYKNFTPARMREVMHHWLDRQAAITTAYCTSEDESCCEACRAAQKRKIAELTAERDELSRDLTAEHALLSQFEYDNEQLRKAIDAMNNGQFYAMYRKACEERDHFKDLAQESAERTCVPHGEWERISQTQEFRRMYCDCGYELGMDRHETFPYEYTIYFSMPYFCPECGARIVSKANAVTDE